MIRNQKDLNYYKIRNLSFLSVFALLFLMSMFSGFSRFSPDSWAYYELSNSIITGDFFKFNTYRSYFSNEYSASFPLGYPLLLAAANYFYNNPINAIYLNLIIALLSWVLILIILENFELRYISSIVIATSIIINNHYLDELYAGRSIPFALFFLLFAFYFFIKRKDAFFGLCLGISSIIRFDYLLVSIIFQLVIFLLGKHSLKRSFVVFLFFLLGISPWLIYSQLFFGKVWVSDNSWVALSAVPAFVVDFPAISKTSLFDNPLLWTEKVLQNGIILFKTLVKATIYQPFLLLSMGFAILFLNKIILSDKKNIIVIFAFSIVSLLPYVATGYFDFRYYHLFFIAAIVLINIVINKALSSNKDILLYDNFLKFSLFVIALYGAALMTSISKNGYLHKKTDNNTNDIISILNECQNKNNDVIYVFSNEYTLAARYGAVTKNKSAFLPTNFKSMNDYEKENYFNFLKSYALIDLNDINKSCPRIIRVN